MFSNLLLSGILFLLNHGCFRTSIYLLSFSSNSIIYSMESFSDLKSCILMKDLELNSSFIFIIHTVFNLLILFRKI